MNVTVVDRLHFEIKHNAILQPILIYPLLVIFCCYTIRIWCTVANVLYHPITKHYTGNLNVHLNHYSMIFNFDLPTSRTTLQDVTTNLKVSMDPNGSI